MTARLKISRELSLPLAAATQTFGILAKKGAGKSNAAVVMAEEMYDAGVAWVAIDPKGDWWGVRSSANGKGPGLPVVVFGGRHGDVPLEATAGALIADLVNEKGLTCVLDVSEFSKADQRRFLIAFGERLYRARADEAEIVHLFLEEAHEYLPQRVMRDETQVVNTWGRIVKQGRFRGLGCTLVSQRSASLNKDVLTQVDTLIVLRTTAPQDRKAVEAWVEEHDVGRELVSSLPGLTTGEAWVWSPEFLRTTERIRFRQRRTFDSGATPEVGKSRRAPATLADVDLAAIKEQMAETIEKAKADDPKELRRRIASLEKELKVRPAQQVEVEVPVEVPVLSAEDVTQLADIAHSVLGLGDQVSAASGAFTAAIDRIVGRFGDRQDVSRAKPAGDRARAVANRSRPDRIPQRADSPSRRETGSEVTAGEGLSRRAERSVLTALAQYPDGRTLRQLALLTGYSGKGGGFRNAVGRLRSLGYIEPQKGEPLRATDAGLDALGSWEPLPEGQELVEHWLAQLGRRAEKEVLRALVEAWPDALSADEIAVRCDPPYEASGGGFRNALGKLRTLEVIEGPGDALHLVEEIGELL